MTDVTKSFLLALLAAFIAASAAATAALELAPLLNGGETDRARFDRLAAGKMVAAPSSYAKAVTLEDCLGAMTSIYGRVQPHERLVGVLDTCREMARRVAATDPAHGLAWHVMATASAGLGDGPALNSEFVRAVTVAPNEMWLASLRIDLARESLDSLDGLSRLRLTGDLQVMAETHAGRTWLAARYVADPAFRSLAAKALDTLADDRKRSFLDAVRIARGS